MADVGQNEDFTKAIQKAKAIGAKDVSFIYFLCPFKVYRDNQRTYSW